MKQNAKLLLLALLLTVMPFAAHAQVVVGSSDEYDFDYLTPKTYEIGGISFEGADNFDTRVVQLVAGLQVGDQVRIPGDKISGAIENLWKQGMFDDVQIRVNRIQGNLAFLTIVLKERPRLLKFAFTGVKKGEDKKLREEMQIKTGDVVTENMLRTSSNKIKSYFIDKGFTFLEGDVGLAIVCHVVVGVDFEGLVVCFGSFVEILDSGVDVAFYIEE
jgi:outer membrane protein insertion porin family